MPVGVSVAVDRVPHTSRYRTESSCLAAGYSFRPDQGFPEFISAQDWHARIQRTQFFAKALASLGHRCFLLNPHLGREFPGMDPECTRLARLSENIYELHIRLPDEPVYHHSNLNENEWVMLAAAGRLLQMSQKMASRSGSADGVV